MPARRESILVVDSNDASRQALCELLRAAGYDVAESASQAEGFDFVRNTGVDLLLLSADLACGANGRGSKLGLGSSPTSFPRCAETTLA